MNRPNSNLFIATKAKIRGRQDCLTITVNKQNGQLKHATLQMSKNDCENATNINLGATNKLLQVGKFTNTEPLNRKDSLCWDYVNQFPYGLLSSFHPKVSNMWQTLNSMAGTCILSNKCRLACSSFFWRFSSSFARCCSRCSFRI